MYVMLEVQYKKSFFKLAKDEGKHFVQSLCSFVFGESTKLLIV